MWKISKQVILKFFLFFQIQYDDCNFKKFGNTRSLKDFERSVKLHDAQKFPVIYKGSKEFKSFMRTEDVDESSSEWKRVEEIHEDQWPKSLLEIKKVLFCCKMKKLTQYEVNTILSLTTKCRKCKWIKVFFYNAAFKFASLTCQLRSFSNKIGINIKKIS